MREGRPLKKRGPVPIGEVISEVTRSFGEEASKRGKVASFWQKAIGKKKGLHAKISTFENGVLTIAIDNSSSLYELSLEKETLLQKLQEEFGSREVNDIRLQMGK